MPSRSPPRRLPHTVGDQQHSCADRQQRATALRRTELPEVVRAAASQAAEGPQQLVAIRAGGRLRCVELAARDQRPRQPSPNFIRPGHQKNPHSGGAGNGLIRSHVQWYSIKEWVVYRLTEFTGFCGFWLANACSDISLTRSPVARHARRLHAKAPRFGPGGGELSRDHAAPPQKLEGREYWKRACEVAVEHVLIHTGIDPGTAHTWAEQISEIASKVAERAAHQADVTRGQLGGMVQRVGRNVAQEIASRSRDAANVGPISVIAEQVADSFQRGLAQELQHVQLRDPGLARLPQNQPPPQQHQLSGRDLAKNMQKTGRAGRVIPNTGREQRGRERDGGR
jgi:hypothetical protein